MVAGCVTIASVSRNATLYFSSRSLDSKRSILSNIASSAPSRNADAVRNDLHSRQLWNPAPRRVHEAGRNAGGEVGLEPAQRLVGLWGMDGTGVNGFHAPTVPN